ncbi:unnamed protein product [Prorocentrum cordatum]|uniref:Cysteine desulfurase n=1 Tax=Prorocentrum cordatum TaxID=2364126 RepID=A0ABN9RSS2_9DINO|nr:unnamed protein product [Polarella glacialis]
MATEGPAPPVAPPPLAPPRPRAGPLEPRALPWTAAGRVWRFAAAPGRGLEHLAWCSRRVQAHAEEELGHLGAITYLDHAGAAVYSGAQVRAAEGALTGALLANPHSSRATEGVLARARAEALGLLGASPETHTLAFTSGAGHALESSWARTSRGLARAECSSRGRTEMVRSLCSARRAWRAPPVAASGWRTSAPWSTASTPRRRSPPPGAGRLRRRRVRTWCSCPPSATSRACVRRPGLPGGAARRRAALARGPGRLAPAGGGAGRPRPPELPRRLRGRVVPPGLRVPHRPGRPGRAPRRRAPAGALGPARRRQRPGGPVRPGLLRGRLRGSRVRHLQLRRRPPWAGGEWLERGTPHCQGIAAVPGQWAALRALGPARGRRMHAAAVCREAYLRMRGLRHAAGGRPLCTFFGRHEHPRWPVVQGPTIAFALRWADGSGVPPGCLAARAAARGVVLHVGGAPGRPRAGRWGRGPCRCGGPGPRGCRCAAPQGWPAAAASVSFGLLSTLQDVGRWVTLLREEFLDRSAPPASGAATGPAPATEAEAEAPAQVALPGRSASEVVEKVRAIREQEFGHLGQVAYLDHAGAALYSREQARAATGALLERFLASPERSAASAEVVEGVRADVSRGETR